MDNTDRKDQLEKHSLPGTNQAGKGAEPGELDKNEKPSRGRGEAPPDQLEEHSLPGTNQAGKGADPGDTRDRATRPDDK